MWLSLHLYHADGLYDAEMDRLLVDGVEPLLGELAAQGLLERAFFVRYADPDPHLRLRLRVSPSASRAAVVERTRHWASQVSPFDGERWDALREVDYVPELGRYGGADGMGIAEEQFDLSSRVALEVLRHTRRRGRSFLLGRSVLLSLVLVLSLLDVPAAARDFLRGYSDAYRRHLPDPVAALAGSAEASPGVESAVAALQRAWQDGRTLGTALLDEWAQGCRRIRSQLDEAGARVLGPDPQAGRRGLLSSYLHMHHNRLGIGIAEEVALTRLVAGALARQAVI